MSAPDLAEILQAWATMIRPSPEQQALAESRAKICHNCEHLQYIHVAPERFQHMCWLCRCPITAKVYTPKGIEGCPLKKWKE